MHRIDGARPSPVHRRPLSSGGTGPVQASPSSRQAVRRAGRLAAPDKKQGAGVPGPEHDLRQRRFRPPRLRSLQSVRLDGLLRPIY